MSEINYSITDNDRLDLIDWVDCPNTVFHNHVETGIEQSHESCPICRAKRRWNASADSYNQWSELGEDEKQELIETEIIRKG